MSLPFERSEGSAARKRLRISILTKFVLTILAVTLFTLGPVMILAVRGFQRDKSIEIYERNNLIARNVASESHALLADAVSKMRVFADVYLDPGIATDRRVEVARNIFSHYGEFVRLSILPEKPGGGWGEPVRVYNQDAMRRGGFTDRTIDAAIDRVPMPEMKGSEGGVWVLNRTPSVELPLLSVASIETLKAGRVMLIGDLLPDSLFNLFQSEGATQIYLLDGQGRIVAHPDAARMASRASAAPDLVKLVSSAHGNNNNTREFRDEDGEQQLGTYAAVGLGGTMVVAHTPERVAFAAARQLEGRSVALAVVVFLLGAAASVYLARRMTRPLLVLSGATEKIARGEFGTTVTVGSADEIGDLAVSFNKMGEELKERERKLEETRAALVQSEKMAAFGQLGAGIAHEVKNPLAGILGYAQLALRKVAADSPLKNYLEIIEKETKRCKAIIENLLKFARQEKTVMDRVDVPTLLEESLKLVEHQLSLNGVKIERRIDPGLPAIFANANQLQQVLMNLSINAQHAMEKTKGGTLTVSARRGTLQGVEGVEIDVTDSGCGIPKEIQTKIFEPFFTTKPAGKGTGLGLSVTYGIVRDHKGAIAVESVIDVGTTFRMVFPLDPGSGSQPPAG